MNPTNRPNQTGRLRRIALFYLALSAAASSLWTRITQLIFVELPLWGSIIIFLALFLFTFTVLTCIAVGAEADMPEPKSPALREDRS